MAVLKMQRFYIYALQKERKRLLEVLQRLGVTEVGDVVEEDSIFHKQDVSRQRGLIEKNIGVTSAAIGILNTYVPEKKSPLAVLSGRHEIVSEQYDGFAENYERLVEVAQHICELEKEIGEQKGEILKLQAQIQILTPWQTMDLPMNFCGTKSTATFVGTLPGAWSLEKLYEQVADLEPIHIEIMSESRDQTCIFVLCLKTCKDSVFEAIRAIGFTYPDPFFDKVPVEQLEELQLKEASCEARIRGAEQMIRDYESQKQDLCFLQDYEAMRTEKYEVIGQLLQSKNVFVITGYVPEIHCERLEQEVAKQCEVAVEFEVPTEEEDVPVLVHNNGFAMPLESTVEAFSPPGKHEIDPTMVMSLFYYCLFGLMLSDAAYGLIITLGCGIILLKFKKTLETPLRNTLKMFLYCGISTIFWGMMFGSYFGDLVDVVSATFFGQKVSIPPLWFFPVNEPMRMLVFCMLIGVIHLYTGLGMKLYQCIKQKDYEAIWYDIIIWYVLLTSSILILLSMELFVNTLGISFILPKWVGSSAGIVAIISAIGITVTNGRESKNPFKRVLKGLYALYGITGYLSDVLSYSRLLALGLATGVICTVINKMASMTAGGPLGVVLFVVICVLGHTLNIGINALGAYVHTNRLQYVEFFGKFYEGGGRKFRPFSVKTKYYKFKEAFKHE